MAQEMQEPIDGAMDESTPNQPQPGILSSGETIPEPAEKTAELDESMEDAKEQLTPEEISQLDAYVDNATTVIFTEKTQPAILQELQSSPNPIESVAFTANHIHKILFDALEKQGESMTDKTLFLGATHVVSELHLLAEAAGLFTLSNEEKLNAFQYTLLVYFKEGMESGKIDPVELQKELEPLMTEEQRQYGVLALSRMGDISKTPPPGGQKWSNPPRSMAPAQQQQAPPQQTAEVKPGLLGQGRV